MAEAVFCFFISVIVIPRTNDIGYFVVEPFECLGRSLPLLFACLVSVYAVRNPYLVLLNQISGTQNPFDIQRPDTVGDPVCLSLEQRLVRIELVITLRIG